MSYAVVNIDTGIVENIIECDPDFVLVGKLIVEYQEGCAIGGTYEDGVFTLPADPSEEYIPDTPILYAVAQLDIGDFEVTSVTPSAKISAAFYIDTGVYWVFFKETQADTNYIPLCYNHDHQVYVSEKHEDFFVINAEKDGLPSDPVGISLEIKRVI